MDNNFLKKPKFYFVLTITVFSILLISSASIAGISVSDPTIDEETGGDWRGIYGDCFYVLPNTQLLPPDEEKTGPGWYSMYPDNYDDNTCMGGFLFDPVPAKSDIDFRIFRETEDIYVLAWWLTSPGQPPKPGGAQYIPCLLDKVPPEAPFKATTWDSGDFEEHGIIEPLVAEIKINFTGSLKIAYYFLEAENVCRTESLKVIVTDIESKKTVVQEGQIDNFSQGKYVVFDISGLTGETSIRIETKRLLDGDDLCPERFLLNNNSHLSGIFISDCVEAEPCIEIKKQVKKEQKCSSYCTVKSQLDYCKTSCVSDLNKCSYDNYICKPEVQWIDADTAKEALEVKDSVEYRFVVTNCGDVALEDVIITDEKLGIDGINIGTLDVGEERIITKETQGFEALLQESPCDDDTCYETVCEQKKVYTWKKVQLWCGFCVWKLVCEWEEVCEEQRIPCDIENVAVVEAGIGSMQVTDEDSAFVTCPVESSCDNNWWTLTCKDKDYTCKK